MSDLEFSPGLREPPQQVVARAPAPWRPPLEAAGSPSPVIEALSPSAGPGGRGALVTIRGRHLRVAQVMFGSAAARVVAAGPTEVTVEVPPAPAGRVPVALTNGDGTFALAAEPFTITP